MANRNPNVGRHFTNSPPAKMQMPPIGGPQGPPTRGIKPANSRQNQAKDSGGKIFNPVQKPKSNITGQNMAVTGGQPPAGYPGMNVQAVGHPQGINGLGAGKTDKRVAGIQKFYGK